MKHIIRNTTSVIIVIILLTQLVSVSFSLSQQHQHQHLLEHLQPQNEPIDLNDGDDNSSLPIPIDIFDNVSLVSEFIPQLFSEHYIRMVYLTYEIKFSDPKYYSYPLYISFEIDDVLAKQHNDTIINNPGIIITLEPNYGVVEASYRAQYNATRSYHHILPLLSNNGAISTDSDSSIIHDDDISTTNQSQNDITGIKNMSYTPTLRLDQGMHEIVIDKELFNELGMNETSHFIKISFPLDDSTTFTTRPTFPLQCRLTLGIEQPTIIDGDVDSVSNATDSSTPTTAVKRIKKTIVNQIVASTQATPSNTNTVAPSSNRIYNNDNSTTTSIPTILINPKENSIWSNTTGKLLLNSLSVKIDSFYLEQRDSDATINEYSLITGKFGFVNKLGSLVAYKPPNDDKTTCTSSYWALHCIEGDFNWDTYEQEEETCTNVDFHDQDSLLDLNLSTQHHYAMRIINPNATVSTQVRTRTRTLSCFNSDIGFEFSTQPITMDWRLDTGGVLLQYDTQYIPYTGNKVNTTNSPNTNTTSSTFTISSTTDNTTPKNGTTPSPLLSEHIQQLIIDAYYIDWEYFFKNNRIVQEQFPNWSEILIYTRPNNTESYTQYDTLEDIIAASTPYTIFHQQIIPMNPIPIPPYDEYDPDSGTLFIVIFFPSLFGAIGLGLLILLLVFCCVNKQPKSNESKEIHVPLTPDQAESVAIQQNTQLNNYNYPNTHKNADYTYRPPDDNDSDITLKHEIYGDGQNIEMGHVNNG